MELFLLAIAAAALSVYLIRKHYSGYSIDHGFLVVNTGFSETRIPMSDIVEVVEMDQIVRQSTLKQTAEKIVGKQKHIAVFTRSNVSYLFVMKNTKRLIKSLKEQNPRVHIKARAKTKTKAKAI
ncbi:hypothetical protein JOC78_002154 [Bacillus ectoiniformans]|uniref:hypothetical protein n=1 Tax=Bacillus ectoiniformans TaxID=1494429 RepID=UPI001956D452|nr:hypothetical protein [Bacillus ectoiniformans]MBM7649201.1 hypothetical protein [Bacillus ectoiniformans]